MLSATSMWERRLWNDSLWHIRHFNWWPSTCAVSGVVFRMAGMAGAGDVLLGHNGGEVGLLGREDTIPLLGRFHGIKPIRPRLRGEGKRGEITLRLTFPRPET